jgi:hypothetical protein
MPTPVTREQVMTALLASLAGIKASGVPLKSIGRRVRDPENVSSNDRPALFLVEHMDSWERPAINLPAKRALTVWALLYTDVGTDENLIPMTQINQFIEAIEAALAPDTPILNRFTLGGIVFNCMLEGEGIRAAGDTTGKSVAAIPIKIILP